MFCLYTHTCAHKPTAMFSCVLHMGLTHTHTCTLTYWASVHLWTRALMMPQKREASVTCDMATHVTHRTALRNPTHHFFPLSLPTTESSIRGRQHGRLSKESWCSHGRRGRLFLCLFRMGDKFTPRVCTRALRLPRQQQGSCAEQGVASLWSKLTFQVRDLDPGKSVI